MTKIKANKTNNSIKTYLCKHNCTGKTYYLTIEKQNKIFCFTWKNKKTIISTFKINDIIRQNENIKYRTLYKK